MPDRQLTQKDVVSTNDFAEFAESMAGDYAVSIDPRTIVAAARFGYRVTYHAESGDVRFMPPSEYASK